MIVLKTILFSLFCIFANSVFAQNLMSTPISVAPYYFNAAASIPPPMNMPYQLPPYWQQQQYNPWSALAPAFTQFASSLSEELSKGDGDIIYGDDYERRTRRNFRIRSEFLYERPNKTATASATPTPTPTATPTVAPSNDQCEECLSNGTNDSAVITDQTKDIVLVVSRINEEVLDERLLAYQNSEAAKKLVQSIRTGSVKRRNARRQIIGTKTAGESLSRCLMYVKFGMLDSGYFRNYPNGQFASDFSPALKAQGFVNIMNSNGYEITDPDKAPMGSIIVYENTPGSKRPGHIEVKLDNGDYGSDYIDDQARSETSSQRKIIGIYVKLPENKS